MGWFAIVIIIVIAIIVLCPGGWQSRMVLVLSSQKPL
jgi:hypothetical protein